MEFSILGPLVVRDESGVEIEVSGKRRRTLLLRLLVDANRPVPSDRLAEDVWQGAPPAGAAQTLQSHVSHLRKVLGRERIRTSAASYEVAVDGAELDAARFEASVGDARAALQSGDAERAAARLGEGLAFWRGTALADVSDEAWAAAEVARLGELRLVATELLLEAWLLVGEVDRVITEAARQVRAHPLRERFWSQRMLALYRAGRQAEALRAYAELRDLLREELGVDPSAEIAELEQAILEQRDSLAAPRGPVPARVDVAQPTGVVTFVLTDIVGSTRLWEEAPAAMADALERHDGIVRRAITDHGGVLLKARGEGDSTFSVFHRASDAIAACLELQEALVAETWPPECPVAVRAAVHSGESLERDGDYYGRTVNRAARLRSAAGAGQILVGATTAQLVVDDLPAEARLVEIGPQMLRDIHRPETVYLLESAALEEGRAAVTRSGALRVDLPTKLRSDGVVPDEAIHVSLPERLRTGVQSAFIGRAAECSALDAALGAAIGGERRVAFIGGEPGIGKTSLASALARTAFERGAVVLYGRSDEELGIPYQPWIDALTHLVRAVPDDVLVEHAHERGMGLAVLVPDLARRVRAPVPSSNTGETDRYLLFGSVVALLARVCESAPVVLVLDDLHAADRPTLQLLRHVIRGDDAMRLLIVATFREDEVPADHPLAETLADLHNTAGVERVMLRGLRDREVLELLENLAGHEMNDDGIALRDQLVVETDGNPFFIGEILRHLAETDVIVQEGGRWVARADLRTHGLPVSVREVIGRRVARLGSDAERVLATAAAVGREFDVALLAAIVDLHDDDVIDLCDRGVGAFLVIETDDPDRYAFAHALVEHTLYDGISGPRRARLHRAIAKHLEQLATPDPRARAAELAHHWSNAGGADAAENALGSAQQAGDHAIEQLAPDEAQRWYRHALGLLEAGARGEGPRTRAELLAGLGHAQRDLGDPEHRATLLAAAQLADHIGASDVLIRAALANHRGWNSVIGGVDHERVEVLTRALGQSASDSPERARLLATLCAERHYDTGIDERVAMAEDAIRIARNLADPATLTYTLYAPFMSVWMPQTLEQRTAWSAEACRCADRDRDPVARFWSHNYRALAALCATDRVAFDASTTTAAQEGTRIGQPSLAWEQQLHDVACMLLAGDLSAAEERADAALELGTAIGQPDAVEIYGGHLLTIRWMQGRLDEGLDLMRQTVADNPRLEVFSAALTFSLARTGRIAEAAASVADAHARDFAMFEDANWLVSQVLYAEAAATVGDTAAAELLFDRLAPWQDQFAATHSTVIGSVAHYLALVACALQRYDTADELFAKALAAHTRMQAPYFVAATQARWAGLISARGDESAARAFAAEALACAREAGYGYVELDALAVGSNR